MNTKTADALLYKKRVEAGAANLKAHADEINDLNVFPIPDGDTGDNMLLTVLGGAEVAEAQTLGETARNVANGMLLSARGNSGVILAQFFDGIAAGLDGVETADVEKLAAAMNAVSYTHLDVYKRQVLFRVLLWRLRCRLTTLLSVISYRARRLRRSPWKYTTTRCV